MKTLASCLLLTALVVTPASAEWDRRMRSDNGDAEGCGSTRFTCVLGREAVRDNETGLVWERSPGAVGVDWFEAVRSCWQLEVTDRLGWHLPTIEQIASLLQPSEVSALPANHPFLNLEGDAPRVYWSQTTDVRPGEVSPAIWVARLEQGGVGDQGVNSPARAWCVRGGNILDMHIR